MKVEIKVCQADWVERYSDGMACVTTTEYYPTKTKAKAELKKDYSSNEIDIDPDNYEYGWFLHLETLTFDTNDKFKIIVTP